MTPQLEALAMLNNMFESYDGRPVKNAVLSREDYALLAQALTARTSYAAPEAGLIPLPLALVGRLLSAHKQSTVDWSAMRDLERLWDEHGQEKP